ncbi:MAG: hypothetical protein P4L84_21830 [Isosphaeraceae bacterium]|nr:hypothetical protein [Isosphaeraceae bacterium]
MTGPDAFDDAKPASAVPGANRADHSTSEQEEFLAAIERYRRLYHRPFPTWSEILEVAAALGYRKAARATRGRRSF